MRIAIVTDAWLPQVNGVVTTLTNVVDELVRQGHQLLIVGPEQAVRRVYLPRCREIELAFIPRHKMARILDDFQPEAIHIATEGPVGLVGRRYCITHRLPFNTAYHTRYPEYLRARWKMPLVFSYRFLRWFHGRSSAMLVATPAVVREMRRHGFRNTVLWERGVDTQLFSPRSEPPPELAGLPRPVMLYVGRVAVEKNLDGYLKLDVPGTKLVIGEGPELARLRARYPQAHFLGVKPPEELARFYSASDVFVFPSLTDTFGLVLLESIACGTPVAAYPVPGPVDVVKPGVTGVLDTDLERAVEQALLLDRGACAAVAQEMNWQNCARQFVEQLAVHAPPQARTPRVPRLAHRRRRLLPRRKKEA
jgi:glycosyltransferase involved in cell wall biosynthesis